MNRINLSRFLCQPARKLILPGLIALSISFFFWGAAQADVAPNQPPAGTNPLNGSDTQVQMAAETVIFDIAASSSYQYGQAKVTATFRMHNTSVKDESMTVKFPLAWWDAGSVLTCEHADYHNFPPILDLAVWVNGFATPTTIEMFAVTEWQSDVESTLLNIPCWADFPVTFPAGKDTSIRVTYTSLGYQSYYSGALTSFHYILTTGAGWNGPIGSADLIFRFPYDVTSEALDNVTADQLAADNLVIAGKDVVWHKENFKPDYNPSIEMINPSLWINVLEARRAVKLYPDDSEAWGQLGKAYKEAGSGWGYIDDHFFELSAAAYQKSLSLAPDDADWHYGYAELVCSKATKGRPLPSFIDITVCIKELETTLKLHPNYPKALEYLLYINSLVPYATQIKGTVPPDLVQTAEVIDITMLANTEVIRPTHLVYATVITLAPSETITMFSGGQRTPEATEVPTHAIIPSPTASNISPGLTPSPTGAIMTPSPLHPVASTMTIANMASNPPGHSASLPYILAGLALLIALGVWLFAARRSR